LNEAPREPPAEPPQGKLSLLQTVGSVLASFFGVQSMRHRERDFSRGSAPKFIAVGLVATLVFILTLWLVVHLVLRQAGM
jgi:hypothetical protein